MLCPDCNQEIENNTEHEAEKDAESAVEGACAKCGTPLEPPTPPFPLEAIRQRRKKKQKALMMIALLVIVIMIGIPIFLKYSVRKKATLALENMRTMSEAIEAYFQAESEYPAHSVGENSINGTEEASFMLIVSPLRTVEVVTLTSPVAFLDDYLPDPFAPQGIATFNYFAYNSEDVNNWMLWSMGPDGEWNIKLNDARNNIDWSVTQPEEFILSETYDPTNGVHSSGDILLFRK